MRTNLFANFPARLVLFISGLHILAYGFTDTTFDDLGATNHIVSLFCSESFEYKIKNIGDINGDGIEDLAIFDWDNYPNDRIYIVFGSKNNASSIDLDNLLTHGQGFMIYGGGGVYENNHLGFALSPAGDINNDGVNDFIVGGLCEAYVFFGRKEGFTNINLTTISQTQAFRIYSPECNSTDLVALSNAGDFNNDGIDDIMIGITTESPLNRFHAGSVYILFGHPGTFSNVNLSEFGSGTQGLKIIGAESKDSLGGSVSSVGDFNDDGIDDVILALALDYSFVDSNNKEKLYVIYGHEGEFQDLDLATLTKGQGFQIITEDDDYRQDRDNRYWWYWLIANAGDFNGDGINDIAFAISSIYPIANSSLIYVIFGVSGGLDDFALNDFPGSQGFQVIPASDEHDIYNIANSADINGDGMSDLIFGFSDSLQVIYGRKDTVPQVRMDDLTSADGFRINLTSLFGHKWSADSIDFNNDGALDLAIGLSTAPHVSVILNTYPKSKTNVPTIIFGTVGSSVLVIVSLLIYVKRRGLNQKTEANKKKMEYISQMSNQDSLVAVSWHASPGANSRENAPINFKRIPQEDQENSALPETFIELSPKRVQPENTSVPVEKKEKEESQSAKI